MDAAVGRVTITGAREPRWDLAVVRDPDTVDEPLIDDVEVIGSMGFLLYRGVLYVRHFAHGPGHDLRAAGMKRRADLKADGMCAYSRTHGKATHGELCHRCRAIRRLGIAAVRVMERKGDAPWA